MTRFALFSLATCLFTSCCVGPVYQEPELCVPEQWHNQPTEEMNTDSPCENFTWWECLQDPVLNELMDYAAKQNIDLHIAATRVLQARSEAKAKKSDLYPHIDASLNGGHLYYSKDALVNGLLGTAVPKRCLKKHVTRNVDFFEAGFDVDWELDFFGFTAHEIAAAKARQEALEESLCGVWVTLSAEIAKNYIELRGLQQRLEITQNVVAAHAEIMVLTQELLERGVVNESDQARTQADWSALKADVPLMHMNIARTMHRIAILLGYPPGDLFEYLSASAALPSIPAEAPIGMPSELLRRRPDIRKAERELAAATEKVGSAIASLFPRFSLRGFIGDISTRAGSLFTPGSFTWLAGPQMLVPIFNSRLILEEVEYNKISTQQAMYTYQKTVLEALEETENAIATYKYEQERLDHLKQSYEHNQNALSFAKDLHERGLLDNFEVVKIKKPLLASENVMVQSQVDLLLNYVSLYKALGGSWKSSCNDLDTNNEDV